MTCNVFGGTLNLTQSNHLFSVCDQASSIFFFLAAAALVLCQLTPIVICWMLCLVSV